MNICFDNDLCRSVDEISSFSTHYFLKIDFLQSTYPKMVFTVNQIIAFYEDNNQMSLPQATRLQLVSKGLGNVYELLEFYGESIKGIAYNLRRPGGRIPDPDLNAVRGDMIPTPPFLFGAKSQMRLKGATMILRYYETVGREITAPDMR